VSGSRPLILIPHPDDEVVGCATAIVRARAAGAAVSGLYLTTGVPARGQLWPWHRKRYAALIATRREEAERAAHALGLSLAGFLDWPARPLKSHIDEAMAAISRVLGQREIDEIWTPAWEGGHQDHDVTNFLASRFAGKVPLWEFAEYNLAGGRVRSQSFPQSNGTGQVLTLTTEEARFKAELLSTYRSERGNLRYVRLQQESFRPLAQYDYRSAPHLGRLFCERFQWVPFRHPRVDLDRPEVVREMLAEWAAPLR